MSGSEVSPLGTLVEIAPGRQLHYVAAGRGSPMVVFESGGAGGSATQDLPVLRLVSAFTRGCIYDRAGLGWSDAAEPGRSFEERAADLHALLSQVESPPFVLVGLSFGGLLVRAFCNLFGDEVAGVVMVDAAEEEKYFSTMLRMRAFHEAELRAEAKRAASGTVRAQLEKSLQHAKGFSEREKQAILEVVPTERHYLAGLEELSAIDRTPADMKQAGGFGNLGSRPLVALSHGIPYRGPMSVWEEGFAASQERLAALSTAGAHVVATGVGHSIALEHPKLVAAAIESVVVAVRGGEFNVAGVKALAVSPPV